MILAEESIKFFNETLSNISCLNVLYYLCCQTHDIIFIEIVYNALLCSSYVFHMGLMNLMLCYNEAVRQTSLN